MSDAATNYELALWAHRMKIPPEPPPCAFSAVWTNRNAARWGRTPTRRADAEGEGKRDGREEV